MLQGCKTPTTNKWRPPVAKKNRQLLLFTLNNCMYKYNSQFLRRDMNKADPVSGIHFDFFSQYTQTVSYGIIGTRLLPSYYLSITPCDDWLMTVSHCINIWGNIRTGWPGDIDVTVHTGNSTPRLGCYTASTISQYPTQSHYTWQWANQPLLAPPQYVSHKTSRHL